MQNWSTKKRVAVLLTLIFGSLIVLGGSITALVLHLVSTKFTGNLVVDGTVFNIDKCRSGQVYNFSGIQLSDDGGRRLRLIQNPTDGIVSVSLFPTDQNRGVNLGSCGTLSISSQNSRVNYVMNQSGTATLDCDTDGHKVTGSVAFNNCH